MANKTDNTMIKVKNRSAGMVVYRIPEENLRREFAPGEIKKVRMAELEKLSYQAGGAALIANFLQVFDEEVTDRLNIRVENEYYMSEEQIKELILTGSIDAFLDCLDFAPVGVIDLIKQYAVSLPMKDIDKREALLKKTGFNVEAALKHIEEEKSEEQVAAPVASEKEAPAAAGRRTTTNYKIVNKVSTDNK